jgi:hypothetical protein
LGRFGGASRGPLWILRGALGVKRGDGHRLGSGHTEAGSGPVWGAVLLLLPAGKQALDGVRVLFQVVRPHDLRRAAQVPDLPVLQRLADVLGIRPDVSLPQPT